MKARIIPSHWLRETARRAQAPRTSRRAAGLPGVVAACLLPLGLAVVADAGAQQPPRRMNETARINASDAQGNNAFGGGVTAGGGRLFVGAPFYPLHGIYSGALYVYERDGGGSWRETQKLVPSDSAAGDFFGSAAANSGNHLLVSAYGDDDDAGAAYVFELSAGVWVETARLVASNRTANARFATSVALDGTTAVIGTPEDEVGSAFVFERQPDGSWVETARIVAADQGNFDAFGWSVAVQGDEIFVGNLYDDDIGYNTGSVYVFARQDETWVPRQKLRGHPLDGTFGNALAVSGNALLIGAQAGFGAAFLFEKVGGLWTVVERIAAPDYAVNANFGDQVALRGDSALIGAPNEKIQDVQVGAAYLFRRRPAGDWRFAIKMIASDAEEYDRVGTAVALDAGTALVGMQSGLGADPGPGSAWIFAPAGGGPSLP